MSTRSRSALFITAALLLVCTSQASAQEPRTWVSGPNTGDDVNPCTRVQPCRTFAGAISKTEAGGEINATESGAFGAVTITKAITIDVSNVEGGTVNSGSVGVIVNAGVTDAVVLRGLDIYGTNSPATPPCGYGGTSGIRVIKAGSVRIENSRIGRQQKAIEVVPTNDAQVIVNHVEIADNCLNGIIAAPAGAGTAALTVQDSTISNSGTALSVASGGTAWLSDSMLFGNALGYETVGTGVINDFGDNQLVANTVDGTATNNVAPAPPAGPAGADGVAGAPGVAGVGGVTGPAGEPALKLLLATSSSRRSVRTGSPVTVRFAATAAASSTLTISRAGKTLRTVRFASRAGSNAVRWNGRIGNARSTPGAYRLVVKAIGADGQTATAAVALTVKRR
jgi:hypothetical protein